MEMQNSEFLKSRDKISFFSFLEDCFMFLSKHSVVNMIVTFVFCLVILIQVYSGPYMGVYPKGEKLTITDYLFFAISLTAEHGTTNQILDSLEIAIGIAFCLFCTLIMWLFFPSRTSPWIKHFYSIVWYYIIPLVYVKVLNIFIRTEMLVSSQGFTAKITLGMISHVFIVLVMAFGSFLTSSSPQYVLSPFVTQCPLHGLLILAYYSSLSHLSSPFIIKGGILLTLRIIIDILFFIYFAFYPPYLSRTMNFFIHFLISFDIIVVFSNSIYGANLGLAISFMIAIAIEFIIYPLFYGKIKSKRLPFFAYICGNSKKAKTFLEHYGLKGCDHSTAYQAVRIAFMVNASNIESILLSYQAFNARFLPDVFFRWSSANYLSLSTNSKPAFYGKIISSLESEKKMLETLLWKQVWYSNIESMYEISSSIGSCNAAIKFIKEDTDLEQVTMCQSLKKIFGSIEIIVLLFFGLFTMSHLMLMSSNKYQWNYLNDMFTFGSFISSSTGVNWTNYSNNSIIQFKSSFENVSILSNSNSPILNLMQTTVYDQSFSNFIRGFFEMMENETSLNSNIIEALYTSLDIALDSLPTYFFDSTALGNRVHEIIFSVIFISFPLTFFGIALNVYRKVLKQQNNCFAFLRQIPKEQIHYDNNISDLNGYHFMKRKAFVIFYYRSTVWYIMCQFLLVIVYTLLLRTHHEQYNDSIKLIQNNLKIISFSYRLTLWLHLSSVSVSNGNFSLVSVSLSNATSVLDHIWNLDNESQFSNYISDKLLYVLGVAYMQPEILDQSLIYPIIHNITIGLNGYKSNLSIHDEDINRKLFVVLAIQTIFYVFVLFLVYFIKPFSIEETKAIESLIRSIVEDFDPNNNSYNTEIIAKRYFNFAEMPYILFVFDNKKNIIFSSNEALRTLNVSLGDSIEQSSLNESIIVEMNAQLGEYSSQKSPITFSIPFGNNNESLVFSPVYYIIDGSLCLDHVIVCLYHDPTTDTIEIQSKFESLFYQIYPKFIQIDTKFPFHYTPKQGPFIFVLIRIVGFHKWANSVKQVSVIQMLRKELSRIFQNLCDEDGSFYRIYESAEVFASIPGNQSQKLTIWNIHEQASIFAKRVIYSIIETGKKYSAPLNAKCLLYKCKAPQMYMCRDYMALPDIGPDVMRICGDHLKKCKNGTVSIISQKNEMRMQTTTKYAECFSSNGEKYELYLVV